MRALLVLAAAAALALPAAAERAINPPAPEFPHDAAWINAEGLTMRRMTGRKAVLVAFVDFSSPQSLRTLPALQAWFDRYALANLMVVVAITPDLEFQRDATWIKRAVEKHGIKYPVVVDGDRRLWRAFQAEGWPHLFVVDPRGRVVFDRLGEGGHKDMERELRLALSDLTEPELLPPPAEPPEKPNRDCGRASADLFLGARRGARIPSAVLEDRGRRAARAIVSSRDGELNTAGPWEPRADSVRLAEPNRERSAFLRTVYQAAQALAVLSPGDDRKPGRVYVKQDDLWLHAGNAGKSVTIDDDGRSYVLVSEPGLYELTRETTALQPRELYLIPEKAGAGVHAIAFSDACSMLNLP